MTASKHTFRAKPTRLRRCQLAVPGSNERMMAKAAQSAADHVFLDLEDAVAESAKPAARDQIVEALKTLDWGQRTRCVRINDLGGRYAYEDVIQVVERAGAHLDTIMIPKVRTPEDVRWLDILLGQIEQNVDLPFGRIGIEILIEEVEGLINVEQIAEASPRIEALILGMGDFSASQGMVLKDLGGDTGYSGDVWHYARARLVMASRANGIDPIDGPYANFRNPEVYEHECNLALTLGFVGKWAIHPDQIAIAIKVFSPSPEAVAEARRISDIYAKAESDGRGAIAIDGRLVDVASVRLARNLLQRAELMGL